MESLDKGTLVIIGPPFGTEEIVRRARFYARVRGLAGDCARVSKTPLGKPFFPDMPALHFSVSHCQGLWALAFSLCEIGVDMESVRPCHKEAVARRFFHPEEARYVLDGSEERFFQVWTAKESYVKYTGEGITDGFREFTVVRNGRLRGEINGACLRFVPVRQGIFLCVCGGEEALALEMIGLTSETNR